MKKDFEAIEKIAISMANTVWPDAPMSKRVDKLEEEFAELMQQLTQINLEALKNRIETGTMFPAMQDEANKLKDEFGDVLFVLLHLSSMFGWSAKDLLHPTGMKVFGRVYDPNYDKD